jgi:type VI secretion system protein ImpJ
MHPIIWTEGAFLSQQHFQYWEAWLINHQNRLIKATVPDAYGLVSCEIDENSLQHQKIVINSLVMRTEQGAWIVYEGSALSSLATPLEDTEEQCVYLNQPNNQLCSGLSGYDGVGEQAAYHADYQLLKDIYDPQRQHEVTLGIQRLRLSTQPLDQQLYDSFLLCKLTRMGGTHYKLDDKTIPRCLVINASIVLKYKLEKLLSKLGDKSKSLREQMLRLHEHAIKAEFTLITEAYYDLKEMSENGCTHPRELTHYLSKLVFRLGLIHDQVVQPEVYHHHAMGEILVCLIEKLTVLLEQHIETLPSYTMTKTSRPHPSLENINVDYVQGFSWFLGIDFSHLPQESVLKFTTQAKMGTVNTLDQMISSALPGIPLSHVLRPPKQVRTIEGYEYFKLNHECVDWKHVKDEKSLMLYLPTTLDGKKITLDIVKD